MTVKDALAALERKGSKKNRDGMARYGIVAPKAYGVSVGDIRKLGKQIGHDHALAHRLFKSGWYEARMLAAFVADPAQLTPAEMDRWTKDFDNWAICDTMCFHLYDKTPHAWKKVVTWSRSRDEFVKRSAFALLASLAGHDKTSGDAPFLKTLPLIEKAATDDRNFVKKGVSWALRGIGHRSPKLHAAAVKLATKLSKSSDSTERWLGKDALRDLMRPAVRRRFA